MKEKTIPCLDSLSFSTCLQCCKLCTFVLFAILVSHDIYCCLAGNCRSVDWSPGGYFIGHLLLLNSSTTATHCSRRIIQAQGSRLHRLTFRW